MSVKELLAARQAEIDAAKAIRDSAKAQDRDLTDDELSAVETHLANADAYQEQIDAARKQQATLSRLDEADALGHQPQPVPRAVLPSVAPPNVEITGGEASGTYGSFGEWLHDVRMSAAPDSSPQIRQRLYAAAPGMRTDIDSEGGALIPTDFSSRILTKTFDMSPFLSRVTRVPLTGNSIDIPFINETDRGAGTRHGGIRHYWVNETGTLTDSKPDLGNASLKLKKIAVLAYATSEMLDDYSAAGSLLEMLMAKELSWGVEDALINGTGAGRPQGIINAASKIEVTKETNQTAATVWGPNVVKMWARMPFSNRQNAIWLYDQEVEPYFWGLALEGRYGSASTAVDAIPLWHPASTITNQGMVDRLMTAPAFPSEHCQQVGTVGDLILVDPTDYLFIEKGASDASSIHVRFLTDETTFRVTYRCDGASWWTAAVTPANDGDTVSHIVTLAERSHREGWSLIRGTK